MSCSLVTLSRGLFFALLSLGTLGLSASAATLNVPSQYSTIQAAITAASNGDTVLIADGTYTGPGNVDLDFGGKNLTVTSQNGAAKTIIDCGGSSTVNHRGFYLHSGETNAVISGLTVENGYEFSDYGGGIYIASTGSGTISVAGCIIIGNTANGGYRGGGGIYIASNSSGPIEVTNCTVTGNTASSGGENGGGIEIASSSSAPISVSNCEITNNMMNNTGGGIGGGIGSSNVGSGPISVTGCTITNNMASCGGGVYNGNNGTGTITMTDCTLTDNTASQGNSDIGGDGGSIYNNNNGPGPISVANCTITNNTASAGGGVYNGNNYYGGAGPISVSNCTITNNTASGGGGVYNDNENDGIGPISVINCLVNSNTVGYKGGGIYNYNNNDSSGTITVSNCTMVNNTANDTGGIYNFSTNNATGTINTTNTILYNDTGGEYFVFGLNASISYSDIQGGYTGTGNIDADPLFVSGTSPYDLHLQPGSPCLGAGTASGAPTTTIDGYTRPNPPSIGAYELAPVPVPTNLTATAGPGKVTLNWTAPAGVSGATYSVYRGTASGGETFYKSAGTATSFVNTYVTAGTTYYYTVETVVGGRSSAASNEASATPTALTGPPAAPTNLKAVAGDTKVTLTWTAPAGTITSYSVYRGTSATTLTFYKTAGTATNFTNTYVVNGTTYYYAVAAVNSAGTGPQSAVVSATPLAVPGAPTGLTATASGGKITLNWTASTGTVTSYSVYRGTVSGGEAFYKTANTATTFVNTYVTKGTTYFYTVKALNSSGSSLASNEASATP